MEKTGAELQNIVRCGRVMDVAVIHRAYQERMKAMKLPAADLATYMHVTNSISYFGDSYWLAKAQGRA